MTDQELFDFCAKKIIEQGKPSVNEDEKCLYRGPDGTKCAVGHLIPDDEYDPVFDAGEGISLRKIRERVPAIAALPRSLMMSIQSCHDCAARQTQSDDAFLSAFKGLMRDVAWTHDLNAESVS